MNIFLPSAIFPTVVSIAGAPLPSLSPLLLHTGNVQVRAKSKGESERTFRAARDVKYIVFIW